MKTIPHLKTKVWIFDAETTAQLLATLTLSVDGNVRIGHTFSMAMMPASDLKLAAATFELCNRITEVLLDIDDDYRERELAKLVEG